MTVFGFSDLAFMGALQSPTGIVTSNLYVNLDAGQPSSYSGSGSTWNDISGNGYNGTLINSPSYDSGNSGSIVFNGTNTYVDVSAPNPGSLPLTFEFWINSTTANPVGIYDSAPVTAQVMRNFPAGSIDWFSDPGAIPMGLSANTWHQIVVIYRFNTNRFVDYYRNGAFVSSTSGSTNSSFSWTSFKLGGINRPTFNDGSYSGKLAKFAAYTKALSASEVLQNFNALKSRYGL